MRSTENPAKKINPLFSVIYQLIIFSNLNLEFPLYKKFRYAIIFYFINNILFVSLKSPALKL